jgi:pyridoxal phosphate enzyme (YggS family)
MPADLNSWQRIKEELEVYHASLVAVSKTKPVSDILELYQRGQRDFGENYVQELQLKQQELPKDIRWHFIGHLQSNKVRQIIGIVHLIHGVDSIRLLQEISKQAMKMNLTVQVLLQIHIASEETKFGMDANEMAEAINLSKTNQFPNVQIRGLMGMASLTEDEEKIKQEFQHLQQLFISNQSIPDFDILSMGMSSDYKIALTCGSNMIRIGSALFGAREKK